jgi:hypothetical protein
MKEEDIEFIVNSFEKNKPRIEEEIKDQLSEKEIVSVYNDLIKVLNDHNLSYKCALNVAISLTYALMSGAVELYDNEMYY